MSAETDTDEILVQDELTTLKERADRLGIQYHPSIGVAKLREKVQQHMDGITTAPDPVPVSTAATPTGETDSQRRKRLKNYASELVRIRVTCMNPAKAEWEGEILSVGNSLVGTFTKYVPFNADEGWHVPRIMYEQMLTRQCQVFSTVSDSRGNKSRRGKLIKEFGIELLPALTPAELDELARRQALSKAID